MSIKDGATVPGWNQLRHSGLLLDGPRLHALSDQVPESLDRMAEQRLRQRAAAIVNGAAATESAPASSQFVKLVLEDVCGFGPASGTWKRGSLVPGSYGRRAVTGEIVKPRNVWHGTNGASLPVFIDANGRIGIGQGRRVVSQVLSWLRAGGEHLALITNARQWRLVFAGLDYEASCDWDVDLWFEEGRLTPQVTALRTLIQPGLWTPPREGASAPLLKAIRDTRRGQADLSELLGERVRKAVEILVQSHGEALKNLAAETDSVSAADIYRAACRIAMRCVVVLFAESRDLFPRTDVVYEASYGLNGLYGQLERRKSRGEALGDSYGAWPRLLALFRLVNKGSHHPDLPVTAYGGELFAPGRLEANDGLNLALNVFETACFGLKPVVPDRDVFRMLRLFTRTKAKIMQGPGGMWVPVPVDFADLSSEYIGIVYEGLLDYELKTAPDDDSVIFLPAGDRPALPLSRLEGMDGQELRELFKKLKKDSSGSDGEGGEDAQEESSAAEDLTPVTESESPAEASDERRRHRLRAELWAHRACVEARLVKKPQGGMTPERRLRYERKLGERAKELVREQVLPGEWYLARWGGTRKGSGSFYTRPGLSVPTVQRTLRPLAYDPPQERSGSEAQLTPTSEWVPKLPEQVLSVKVCDPACGSGSFVLAALRFLADALYESLQHHRRIESNGSGALVRLLGIQAGDASGGELLSDEQVPCNPDHDEFEPLLKARLRRHVVERCIYAVDLDPLAVELCRLSLWIETMDRTLPFGFLDHKVKCGNALVGAWFDQFRHYPAMAWKNREGGDKNHSNGVHFNKNARGKVIKAFHKDRLTPDLKRFLEGRTLFHDDLLEVAATAHEDALEVLAYMHELPIQDTAERADVYRKDLLGAPEWRALKAAMDLWCACWFWPTDEIKHAPLPTTFAEPPEGTRRVAKEVALRHRFFHWELEFPDVFREEEAGFDAVVGNPPWDIAKPVSMEFFSNIDPLYRSYGKQEALRKQTQYFADQEVERSWLDYCADFRARSNYVGHSRNPFGDPELTSKKEGSKRLYLGKGNATLHRRWRNARGRSGGFADRQHPFRHQGSADLNLYKLFLEAAHALAKKGGRIGFLVPSGLYSDNGTGALRRLLIRNCRWEWLFGIENRAKIFPIHRSYKFNPVIVEKGGSTEAIQTAFMRRNLDDWECAEDIATPYSRAQVEQFSPKSLSILEIQSGRDLEILEKIYANSVLLGDDGPDGWGIRYAREFDMTNDSRLFPPRPKWEAKGYRPDEYSRWLKGDWRPIEELWAELGVDPERPQPAEIELEDWLFDASAGPERREAEARFVHGHWLKPGDVARTEWAVRCAQPPYDLLPVPRVAIPPGIILSRDATEWILEESGIEDVALPLYEGRMIGQFDFSQKGWVSGKGRGAVWREIPWERKQIEPQYLMAANDYSTDVWVPWMPKLVHMRIGSATNHRTSIGAFLCGMPAGDTAATLFGPTVEGALALVALGNSIAFDFVTRCRVSGLHIDYHVIDQNPVLASRRIEMLKGVIGFTNALSLTAVALAPAAVDFARIDSKAVAVPGAVAPSERLRLKAMVDAIIAVAFGLDYLDLHRILEDCDLAEDEVKRRSLNPKGFWRIDKDKPPELRHTVLTLVAFDALKACIRAAGGDLNKGMKSFLRPNYGEGWLLPETLRLADYGLGHDDRARHHQSVASRLGPRFYDWQLAQSPREEQHEWHLHARNLLGRTQFAFLIARLEYHVLGTGDFVRDLLGPAEPSTVREEGPTGELQSTSGRPSAESGILPSAPTLEQAPETDARIPLQLNLFE